MKRMFDYEDVMKHCNAPYTPEIEALRTGAPYVESPYRRKPRTTKEMAPHSTLQKQPARTHSKRQRRISQEIVPQSTLQKQPARTSSTETHNVESSYEREQRVLSAQMAIRRGTM
ncbi:hypothetical protein THAOC_06473 [Thalassiosira oceanica]|uniref:Uncharacterized protein n=1 Tax=Thalassiosira oceanica TaxID=159749 RepID=K0TET7_THAOC|nr:hypothetical protein THAOC_06473 [Thalassiosira oceanica]|eukprot:EJK72036.1 hypothetical protein THAOC_06473 [Thalassiosira oceanica]